MHRAPKDAEKGLSPESWILCPSTEVSEEPSKIDYLASRAGSVDALPARLIGEDQAPFYSLERR